VLGPNGVLDPDAQPSGPEPYQPVPSAPRSAAEVFRARFGALEAKAREKRCHSFIAEAVAAFSKGDYGVAADAYRKAAELAPGDQALAQKVEESARLAKRYRR